MAVKILIRRKIKEDSMEQATRLIVKARYNAMERKGYIASETWQDCMEPYTVVVVSMWRSLEDWNNYKASEMRQAHESELETLLAEPTHYEAYNLGLGVH